MDNMRQFRALIMFVMLGATMIAPAKADKVDDMLKNRATLVAAVALLLTMHRTAKLKIGTSPLKTL
jgi:hypothetical protein